MATSPKDRAVCGCGAAYRIPEGMRGRKAKCKKCGSAFILDGPGAPQHTQDATEPDWNHIVSPAPAPTASVSPLPQPAPVLQVMPPPLPAINAVAGVTLREHCKQAGDRITGSVQFVFQQAQLYTKEKVGTVCGCCGKPQELKVHAVTWRARFSGGVTFDRVSMILLAIGIIRIKEKYKDLEYTTFHGICKPCFRKYRLFRMLGSLFEFTALVLIVIGFGKGVYNVSDLMEKTHQAPDIGFQLVVSILFVVAGIAAFWGAFQLRVPRFLRRAGPWPFRRKKMVLVGSEA